MAKNGSACRGTKRVYPDISSFNSRHGVRTEAINRVKFERMHYLVWIHFKTQTKRFPLAQAQQRWDSALESATDKEKKLDGPIGEYGKPSVSIPMPMSDAVIAQNVVAQAKEFNIETKKRKLTEADGADYLEELRQSHVGFTSSCFDSVGGDTFARAAAAGATSIGAHGAGAFHATTGASPAKSAMAEALGNVKGGAQKIKTTKEYDIATARLKLAKDLDEKFGSLRTVLDKFLADASKTMTYHKPKVESGSNAMTPLR